MVDRPTSRATAFALIFALALASAATDARAGRAEARALTLAGASLEDRGHAAAALEHYEDAIADEPGYLPALDRAIPLWIAGGKLDALTAAVERATLRRPDYARGWYALGYAYRRLGRDHSAVLAYEAYLAMRPDDADAIFGLAMAELAQGRRDPAATALLRYLELERRPERAAFVARARRELRALGVTAPPPHETPVRRAIDELLVWLRTCLEPTAPSDASNDRRERPACKAREATEP